MDCSLKLHFMEFMEECVNQIRRPTTHFQVSTDHYRRIFVHFYTFYDRKDGYHKSELDMWFEIKF